MWSLSRWHGINRTKHLYQCCRCVVNKCFEEDVFDEFTTSLSQKKATKWEAKKSKWMKVPGISLVASQTKVLKLTGQEMNGLFQSAIESDDHSAVISLIKECILIGTCPELSVLIAVLGVCAQNGDRSLIGDIVELCAKSRPEVLQENSFFKHYLAEATWVRGNIVKALEMFEEVYRENPFLRRRIRLVLKCLIAEVVAGHSEAVLVNIFKFAQRILEDFRDFYPLVCVWQACILSEWFADQTRALDLMEKQEGFCKVITKRIPFVVGFLLKMHRTEPVYRLLEVLLKLEMKCTYPGVLYALLNYQIVRWDMERCNEIIRWSLENDVHLPNSLQEQFLSLLLRKQHPSAGKHRETPLLYKF